MRENKFRAWDGRAMSKPFGLDNKHTTFDDCSTYRTIISEVLGWKVMQYTGLHDKNGKEICESDLIVCQTYPFYNKTHHNYVAEIVWYDDAAMFGYEYHAISDRVTGNVVGGSMDELGGIEIIGNIYENEDLLNK